MKQITKEEIQSLVDAKYIKNSRQGYVGKDGFPVGFYRTQNKRYIEDRYANIAARMK